MPKQAAPECELCRARGSCFFSDLKAPEFQEFRDARISNVYKKRQVIFYEGHKPHGVYLVCSGRVKIYKSDHKGHQLTTRIAGNGEILGYRALLASESYSATAEALEESCLAYIDETRFKSFLVKHQTLAVRMLALLARDVRQAEDKARDMAMKSSRERLAELLQMLVASHGKAEKNGATVKLPYTRLDLAELAGLAQETVIRLLTEFEEQKVITMDGRNLTVLDRHKLEKVAGALT